MAEATKILVVDDEPLLKKLILQQFKLAIEANQLLFIFAESGAQALQALQEDESIGIILTDIKMQDMDGLSLIEHLDKHPRIYKIVVVTSYGDMKNIRRSMENGASDFILKPFDIKDLETSLMNVINQYQFVKRGIQAKDKIVELAKELEIAREIKKAFIPTDFSFFEKKGIDLFGEMVFSNFPGGDFFDFFPLEGDKLSIFVANVKSKGIPAVLHTAILQMLARALGITSKTPQEFIQGIHQFFFNEMPSNTILGLFYGVINIKTGEFIFYNTGEVLPYYVSSKKQLVTLIQEPGKLQLELSDKIFVTTSELNLKNKAGEEFTSERIKLLLESSWNLSPQEIVKKINLNFLQFLEEISLTGDIPSVCLEFKS